METDKGCKLYSGFDLEQDYKIHGKRDYFWVMCRSGDAE
jgi:hypothetical protein